MWLVAGLGNPGRKYRRTRHNIGFFVVEKLAERCDLHLKVTHDYEIARTMMGDADVFLLKPLTYMNRSGFAVKEILRYHPLVSDNFIVVHDDIDMELGRLKIKKNGSSGGHRGVQSIIENIGTKDFVRIKIGIGRDPSMDPSIYVLKNFSTGEMDRMNEMVHTAADAVESILTDGVDRAMNIFN